MCSLTESTLPVEKPSAPRLSLKCAKCKTEVPIVSVRRAYFCQACFRNSVVHRFRNSVQRTEYIPHGSKVLLGYSGGLSSSLMLNLTFDYHHVDGNRKAKYTEVYVCHVDEEAVNGGIPMDKQKLKEISKDYGFKVVAVPIEEPFDGETLQEKRERLIETLSSLPDDTARKDFLHHLKMKLLRIAANQLDCVSVFLGDNSTRIAINVMSYSSKGKGLSLPLDIGGEVKWYDDIAVLRPLKEVLAKEVGLLMYHDRVPYLPPKVWALTTNYSKITTIDALSEQFIVGLQRDFPATVSTVTRTALKVKTSCQSLERRCILCEGPIANHEDEWKKLHTINSLKEYFATLNDTSDKESMGEQVQTTSTLSSDSVSPYCYACRNSIPKKGISFLKSMETSILIDNQNDMLRLNQLRAQMESFLIEE